MEKIPRIVHHIWTSGDKFKDKFHEWRLSWMRHNPDFTFMFWELDNLEYDRYTPLGRELLRADLFYEGKMDIATWEILYLHGGIKADIDIECLKSFEPLLQYDSFGGRSYGNFFVGVPLVGMSKGNLIAREAGNAVNTAVATKWKNKYDPGFVKFLDAPPVPALLKCECILPREAFYPLGWGMKNYKNSLGRNSYEDYPNSYAVHHWSSLEEAQNSKAWETIITKAGEKERNSKCVVKRTPRSF